MGIAVRWTADCDEYKAALVTMTERRYRRALDNLERLVVQRLFELTKLSASGLGMHRVVPLVDPANQRSL